MILQSPIFSGSVQISGSFSVNDNDLSQGAVSSFNDLQDKPTLISSSAQIDLSLSSGIAISASYSDTSISASYSDNSVSSSLATVSERVRAGSSGSRDLTTPQSGSLWFNTNTATLEVYNGSSGSGWSSVANAEGPVDRTAELLVVAGGGGGGGDNSGGGGAGGLKYYGTESPATDVGLVLTEGTTYSIVVGAGGSGSPVVNTNASNGGDSSFSGTGIETITVLGGGRGGTGNDGMYNGANGGSGGGGASEGTNGTGGSGTTGQGNDGGDSADGAGGGGGGASADGQNGDVRGDQLGGNGGAGYSYAIEGSTNFYAAGGNGGNENSIFNSAPAVNGIGGRTNPNTSSGTVDAIVNTGSGGGGVTHTASVQSAQGSYGSYGSSGVVILKIYTAAFSAITTGSPTVTQGSEYTILKFTSSGTYTA